MGISCQLAIRSCNVIQHFQTSAKINLHSNMISASGSNDVYRLSDEEYWDSHQGFTRDVSFNSNQADLLSNDDNKVAKILIGPFLDHLLLLVK